MNKTPPPQAVATITTEPVGADLFLDGRHLGESPFVGPLELERVLRLEIDRPGYWRSFETLILKKDESHQFHYVLNPLDGTIADPERESESSQAVAAEKVDSQHFKRFSLRMVSDLTLPLSSDTAVFKKMKPGVLSGLGLGVRLFHRLWIDIQSTVELPFSEPKDGKFFRSKLSLLYFFLKTPRVFNVGLGLGGAFLRYKTDKTRQALENHGELIFTLNKGWFYIEDRVGVLFGGYTAGGNKEGTLHLYNTLGIGVSF